MAPTRVVIFPFDLFGAAGSAAGVELLADELREMLADNRREKAVTRARAYTDQVRIKQTSFEKIEDYQTWREQGRRLARQALDEDAFLLWITGNHLGCLPVYDELAREKVPPLVVQLDAHLDIHNFAGYSPEPSHGNFLLHVESSLPPLWNLGHRELLLPAEHITRFYRAVHPATQFALAPQPILEQLRQATSAASRVFIDIDCDVLDAAFFPAVAQPVPFGLTPQQLLTITEAAWSSKVRGVLLSEFDPARDQNDLSLALLMWLIEYLLLKRYE
jgi:arginase family enzyme